MAQLEKIDELIKKFKNKDKIALARLISIVENSPEVAKHIFKNFAKLLKKSYIIGITGSPGVGKSTLTGKIAEKFMNKGKTIGIVSVDPSSPFSGGAFLGDRIRMTNLTLNPNLFMRSLGSRGTTGGLSRAAFDICLLMEAFGKDIILIETVGAGQSEVDILKLAYTTCVVVSPGMGDSIQIQKAGILEIADILVVNKSDLGGDDIVAQFNMMLDDAITFSGMTGWRPPAIQTNGLTGEGIDELLEEIENHKEHVELSGILEEKRKKMIKTKILDIIKYEVEKYILNNLINEEELNKMVSSVYNEEFSIFDGADTIIKKFNDKLKK
ncbi:MAG: methylmalonyl Co-A mutase-associated GTPase MeaB [Candidatus Helarchaeota archaeon]